MEEKEKKRKNRETPGRRIAQAIIADYKPKSVGEMQATLKEVFRPMFEAILKGEMESYLGYEPNSREEKETTNRRNGYFDKTLKTTMCETAIEVPRDRQASFESVILPKHKRDVSDIENKVLAMYARGMSKSRKSPITCSKNRKVGRIARWLLSIRFFSSTVFSYR